MSSAELAELAERIQPMAVELINDEPFVSRAAERELGHSLALWWIALTRAADSGQAAWDALDRIANHQAALPRDPIARWEATLDYSSAIMVGAMVLEDLAYGELERRAALPGGTRVDYWRSLVNLLDSTPNDPFRPTVLKLDLTLYEARNLLVAHRQVGHAFLPMFGNDGAVTLGRVSADATARKEAVELLVKATEMLAGPIPPTHRANDVEGITDRLLLFAGRLPKAGRDLVKRSYRVAGFTAWSLPNQVAEALGVVGAHMRAMHGT